MKTTALLLPLAALALLTSSCDDDLSNCEPLPTQPTGCVTGKVLGHTCSAGTLIQLYGGRGGQTIQYNADGTGLKTYNHVIATYTELGTLSPAGTRLSFTYAPGGSAPEVQCLRYDAPADMPHYNLSNLSARGCSGDSISTQGSTW